MSFNLIYWGKLITCHSRAHTHMESHQCVHINSPARAHSLPPPEVRFGALSKFSDGNLYMHYMWGAVADRVYRTFLQNGAQVMARDSSRSQASSVRLRGLRSGDVRFTNPSVRPGIEYHSFDFNVPLSLLPSGTRTPLGSPLGGGRRANARKTIRH